MLSLAVPGNICFLYMHNQAFPLCIDDWDFFEKSWLLVIFFMYFYFLFALLQPILPKHQKNLQLLLWFCQTCGPISSASRGFDNLFYLKGATINPLHV
jgi:hypothetical protein